MNKKPIRRAEAAPLDPEEEALMASVEKGEWTSVKDVKTQKAVYEASARATLRKSRRINLRLSEKDFHDIQVRALEEGMPYQTLVASIIHKYLNGTLVPDRRRAS